MNTIAILLSGLLFTASAASAADAPQLQDDDRWEFKASTKSAISSSTDLLDGVYEVVHRGGQLEVFSVDGQSKTAIGGDSAGELKRMILPDERVYLKFPLAVGNKWTGTYRQRFGGFSSTRSMSYTVTGIDGSRYKISGSGTLRTDRMYTQERTFSYSPAEKAIVKYYYDSAIGELGAKFDIELVKFTPGGR